MNHFNKRFTTSDGDTYVYDFVPAKDNKVTFLFIHGCPSSRYDWRHQIADLSEAGYGAIAPDCLGYGDSDKRADLEAYNLKRLSGHFVELLDHENIDKVIGVSHDWGSMVMSRVVVWHPDRFVKLVFMSAGYTAPGVFFDIDGLNVWSQKELGYTQLGYWYFFNSYDAERVILNNLESFFHLAYVDDSKLWVTGLAAINGTREWLTSGKTCPLPTYLNEEDKSRWLEVNIRKNTIKGLLNYYRSLMRGVQADDEESLTDQQRTLKIPVLGICGGEDMVTRADQIGRGIIPYASKGYTEVVLEGAGHWIMLERRAEVSKALLDFAREE
ncbi:epoxide hydrolase [Fusarium heterosporum]|uniref:Epoxide hydrolase n=1 Tax=Fusarium heterosporum TaxID=42747 RepID=A0A8H5TDS9_FUSHE|nr:epoxide hydrolase [Fusarium heterosporum]